MTGDSVSHGGSWGRGKVFCSAGDIRQCLETFLIALIGGYAIGTSWVETRDATKHPKRHERVIVLSKMSVVCG